MLMKTSMHVKNVAARILLLVVIFVNISIASPLPTIRQWKSGATTVTLGEDWTLRIRGNGAMEDYSHIIYPPWSNVRSEITGIVIEDGVTYIGSYVFSGSINLKSVTIPGSVKAIGTSAFRFCGDLTSVTLPNDLIMIADMAFWSTGLMSVTIPDKVMYIGSSAFGDCTDLISINVVADNARYCSENGVLFNKDKTALLFYPRGIQGAYTIPSNVESIGILAFNSCFGLTSVTIPAKMKSIHELLFYGCTSLTSIMVTKDNAHYSSKDGVLFSKNGFSLIRYPPGKLGAYTIPNGVDNIEVRAFYDCAGLTSVTIPRSVTTIASAAFSSCTSLNTVINLNTTPPEAEFYVFADIPSDACLYVPANSINAYRAAKEWKGFACMKALD